MDTPHLVNHGTYLSKGSPSMRQALIWSRQLVASENFFFLPPSSLTLPWVCSACLAEADWFAWTGHEVHVRDAHQRYY